MSAKYPIVVYGISGYTGKLIAEYLTRRHLPFVAAGRDRGRIESALEEAPGAHVADVQAVAHDEQALTRLFTGAKVVIAVVGPFGQLGEPVLRAALAAGAHYLDTTGEQDWATLVRDRYGEAFAGKGLVCSPGCSYMWTAGMIAAEIALEDPYFVERRLYPNVDFYSGIILRRLGIPTNMFTVVFAIGRLPGWIAHWREQSLDPDRRIARPRQVYVGETGLRYVPPDQRD